MMLLWPAALLALAALLLPLLIHLTRRLQSTRTEFAALRWVQARRRPRRRPRLQHWLLLLLRLLLVVVAVLLLAQPHTRAPASSPPWYVVAPGTPAAWISHWQARAPAAARWVWLAPEFPPLHAVQPDPQMARMGASLLRELDLHLPAQTELHVLLPAHWAGADGERLWLGREVHWQVAEPVQLAQAPAAPTTRAVAMLPTGVLLHTDTQGEPGKRFILAAVAGWNALRDPQSPSIEVQMLAEPAATVDADAHTHLLVWLSAQELPAGVQHWIAAGGRALLDVRAPLPQVHVQALVLARSDAGQALARSLRLQQGRIVQLGEALSVAHWPQLAEGDFAAQLQHWLWPSSERVPKLADARAQQPRLDPQLLPAPPVTSLHAALALLLVLLFLLERVCARSAWRSPL